MFIKNLQNYCLSGQLLLVLRNLLRWSPARNLFLMSLIPVLLRNKIIDFSRLVTIIDSLIYNFPNFFIFSVNAHRFTFVLFGLVHFTMNYHIWQLKLVFFSLELNGWNFHFRAFIFLRNGCLMLNFIFKGSMDIIFIF